MKQIQAVILGASGYTGVELVRLLLQHPNVTISALVAESNAGKEMSELYSHLSHVALPILQKFDDITWGDVDVVFGCLPHATSQKLLASVPEHVKIIDLSADFRLRDTDVYEQWYGEHYAKDLQNDAVYGLSEIYPDAIKEARLVACPGCYPTSMLLPLIPILTAKQCCPASIIIDSKSGISGAGRSAKVDNLFTEIEGGVKAYGVGGHRHIAEVEQELSDAYGESVTATFTPQVVPMHRGILSTIYLGTDYDAKAIRKTLSDAYKGSPFVKICEEGYAPKTRDVVSTNQCWIGVFDDRVANRVIIISVIDNLIKGASGQAVQNMNLMFGLAEDMGLQATAVYP